MSLDIRIIVASNENLQESYRKGKFREDLHRFNEFSIHIPLRNRKEDIPLFADFFYKKPVKTDKHMKDLRRTFYNYLYNILAGQPS